MSVSVSVSHALGIGELNFNPSGTLICLIYWNCWTTEKVASKYGGKVDVKAKDELRDSIKDDMEVETEPNVYEQYEEYVTQVEVKQVEDEKKLM